MLNQLTKNRIFKLSLLPFGVVLISSIILGGFLVFSANHTEAQSPECPKEQQGGLVPCGRSCDDPNTPLIDESEPCKFCHFFYLFQNILSWIMGHLVPATSILLITIGGFLIGTSRGNEKQASLGRTMILWTFIGYAAILGAWVLLNSLFVSMDMAEWTGFTPKTENGKATSGWWQFSCAPSEPTPPVVEDIGAILAFRDQIDTAVGGSLIKEWNFDGPINGDITKATIAKGEGIEGGDAMKFDTDGYITVKPPPPPATNPFDDLSNITVTAWVKMEEVPTTKNAIVGRWGIGNANQSFLLQTFINGNFEFVINDGKGKYYEARSADGSIEPNTWYFIVGIYNSAEKKVQIYVNSQETSAGTKDFERELANGSADVKIGGGLSDDSLPGFKGLIDDIRIYNAAYTQP